MRQTSSCCGQQLFSHDLETRPIEGRTGIGFTLRRNIAVTHHMVPGDSRICRHNAGRHLRESLILVAAIGPVITAFQFNADGEIIAPRPRAELRFARMPGPLGKWDELNQLAFAPNEQVRRDFHTEQGRKTGIRRIVEGVGEQSLHPRCAILPMR